MSSDFGPCPAIPKDVMLVYMLDRWREARGHAHFDIDPEMRRLIELHLPTCEICRTYIEEASHLSDITELMLRRRAAQKEGLGFNLDDNVH